MSLSDQANDPAGAMLGGERPEVDGGGGTDDEDGGGGGGGEGGARDIGAVRASAGRGVFYVESKPTQVCGPTTIVLVAETM